MTALVLAIVLTAVAFLYHQVTTLVPLAPLNNAAAMTVSERRKEAVGNAPVMLAPVVLLVIAAVTRQAGWAVVAGVIELVAVGLGILQWWSPYLTGRTIPFPSSTEETWAQFHRRVYARTILVGPPIADRPRPNLEHTILHVLMLAGGVAALVAAGSLAG